MKLIYLNQINNKLFFLHSMKVYLCQHSQEHNYKRNYFYIKMYAIVYSSKSIYVFIPYTQETFICMSIYGTSSEMVIYTFIHSWFCHEYKVYPEVAPQTKSAAVGKLELGGCGQYQSCLVALFSLNIDFFYTRLLQSLQKFVCVCIYIWMDYPVILDV